MKVKTKEDERYKKPEKPSCLKIVSCYFRGKCDGSITIKTWPYPPR